MTPSPSARPFRLFFALPGDASPYAGKLQRAVDVSDSAAPVSFDLWFDRCPTGAYASMTLTCGPDSAAPGVSLYVSQTASALSVVCVADGSPFKLPVAVSATAAFQSAAGSIDLACEAFGVVSGVSLARSALPMQVTPAVWPLYGDVAVAALASSGTLRSALFGTVNATSALVSACTTRRRNVATDAAAAAAASAAAARAANATASNATQSATPSAAPDPPPAAPVPACSLDDALADPGAVLAAAKDMWGLLSVAPNSSAVFTVTLLGRSTLLLRSARRAFDPNTTVTLGRSACNVSAVSSDGAWLVLQTPDAADLCSLELDADGDPVGECGYQTLTLTNPPPATLPAAGAVQLSCPPFCPGGLGTSVPWSAASAGSRGSTSATFVLAAPPLPGALGFPVPIAAAPAASSSAPITTGIYYAASCAASGLYTDPSSGVCAKADNPAAANCAFGSGGNCVQVRCAGFHSRRVRIQTARFAPQCPRGALCPGGSRAWPLPGYYTTSESSGVVLSCLPPDPTSRCVVRRAAVAAALPQPPPSLLLPPHRSCEGWNSTTGLSQCGAAYRQGSYLCESCADGYYPASDGSCSACPPSGTTWARYRWGWLR